MLTLPDDPHLLDTMDEERFAAYLRAVQQYADAIDRSLADFAVKVVGMPSAVAGDELLERAGQLGLAERCRRLLGERDEVGRLFAAASLAVSRRSSQQS